MDATTLTNLHTSWAWVVIMGNALAGIWALSAHSVFIQVILGVIMVNRDKNEFPQFHAFYGFVAIIAIAIIYSYRAQLKSRVYLLYGFGGLFLMGLSIRAMLVGQAA
jgi:hypothetical protein